ncbi:hypothetical protein AVEN_55354-1 [Araneus ventricosus]|uniref:Uncharacterized protein n=1 Tax=Araneus ventricosus TaxID=182803 RepID=A0A4Y2DES0_ARAVE|nr:hypothetical protein AVEN_55354-1 [Araneus ventricosus]
MSRRSRTGTRARGISFFFVDEFQAFDMATTNSGQCSLCGSCTFGLCRDRPRRFPAYHACAGGTFQVKFALALWIEDISDAKSSPEAAEERVFPSFASKSATSLPKTPTWEGIH